MSSGEFRLILNIKQKHRKIKTPNSPKEPEISGDLQRKLNTVLMNKISCKASRIYQLFRSIDQYTHNT